jgi:hypothetical protein
MRFRNSSFSPRPGTTRVLWILHCASRARMNSKPPTLNKTKDQDCKPTSAFNLWAQLCT